MEESKCPVIGKAGSTTASRGNIQLRLVAQPTEPGHPAPARPGFKPNGPRFQPR